MSYVKLIELTKHFGKVRALDGFNLEIRKGEFVALLGPSGCGKTTALRALAGLQELDKGQILVDEKDITFVAANKRNMGMVFQAYSLFPNLTAEENVAFGLQMRKVNKHDRIRRANELLELVGLPSHAKRFAHQLSGGQQQRVGVARALVQKPRTLLADEPVASLDPATAERLLGLMHDICKTDGLTAVVSLHQVEFARRFADRIIGLKGGAIVFDGTPDELTGEQATALYGGTSLAAVQPDDPLSFPFTRLQTAGARI